MTPTFRLFDFEVLNKVDGDAKKFYIKMFGMDEKGKTYCIFIKNFNPFLYVKVPDTWKKTDVKSFELWLKDEIKEKKVDENSRSEEDNNIIPYDYYYITSCLLVKRKDLYGFDGGKRYKFMKISFLNTTVFNKVKNLWYTNSKNFKKRKLLKKGLLYEEDYLKLYEAVLPPLLRYFHVNDISPSGWVTFKKKPKKVKSFNKKTMCDYEYITSSNNIVPLLKKETAVPMKFMSFDIEASSSHGDFPVAKKTYRKLLGEIIQYWKKNSKIIRKWSFDKKTKLFKDLFMTGFGFKNKEGISLVYVKRKKELENRGRLDYKLDNP